MICLNKTSMILKKYNFIDLFCGIGGFRLAMERYGAKCVFSSEWDKEAAAVYEKNFKEKPSGDITKIKEKDIPKHDILCAGFPCQPFSISGKQNGFNDTRGTLFFDIARIAKFHKPKVLILENVKNFTTHNAGKTLKTVLEVLDNLNYDVYHKVLNASLYGVPQKRERIFILGFKRELKIKSFSFPKGQNASTTLRDILINNVEKKLFIKRNDFVFKKDNDLLELKIPEIKAGKPIRIGICNKGGQGERIYSIDGHAITLSAYGGGAGAKTGLYLVDNQVRKLAPRECARAMGFPDEFKIHEKYNQAYKQFGNSVVINVIDSILQKLINDKIL
jgi:DNA (cytosine-5)-methyltransferase 1